MAEMGFKENVELIQLNKERVGQPLLTKSLSILEAEQDSTLVLSADVNYVTYISHISEDLFTICQLGLTSMNKIYIPYDKLEKAYKFTLTYNSSQTQEIALSTESGS